MERGVRARRNARGHRSKAQCRLERGAAAGRYRRAPQAAQRRGAREYAGGVSRLRGGGNGEMGTAGARGQYQAGIADDVGLLLLDMAGRQVAKTAKSTRRTFMAMNACRARELCATKIAWGGP